MKRKKTAFTWGDKERPSGFPETSANANSSIINIPRDTNFRVVFDIGRPSVCGVSESVIAGSSSQSPIYAYALIIIITCYCY
jgi:hypothetical protein